jgi:lipopolysaccharide cholinephosphotransferase
MIMDQTKKLQGCLLGIMKAIDKVCREHNLRYYLIAGTCLGAIRHGGFIPWDDDADIGMPRPDYEVLLAHANEWLPEGYELVCGRTNPNYPYFFARIQDVRTTYILRRQFDFVGGLPVDVFPLDGMTSNPLKRHWHYLRLSMAKKLLYFCLVDPFKHGHGFHSLVARTVRKLYTPAQLHSRLDYILTEFSYDDSTLVADSDNKPSRGILPKAVYGTPIPVTFEGVPLMNVADADTYLRYCYGDYMKMPSTLPPQNYRYLDLNAPYRKFSR